MHRATFCNTRQPRAVRLSTVQPSRISKRERPPKLKFCTRQKNDHSFDPLPIHYSFCCHL
jgi:hypothetical protein